MPDHDFTDAHLSRYLDEQLPVAEMTLLERAARSSEALRRRLASLSRWRDHGGHSIGEVWRRHRISCPDRSVLGSYLLGVLEADHADYVRFHVDEIGCRYCAANLRDLEASAVAGDETNVRRRRYFESSAGLLDVDG